MNQRLTLTVPTLVGFFLLIPSLFKVQVVSICGKLAAQEDKDEIWYTPLHLHFNNTDGIGKRNDDETKTLSIKKSLILGVKIK